MKGRKLIETKQTHPLRYGQPEATKPSSSWLTTLVVQVGSLLFRISLWMGTKLRALRPPLLSVNVISGGKAATEAMEAPVSLAQSQLEGEPLSPLEGEERT